MTRYRDAHWDLGPRVEALPSRDAAHTRPTPKPWKVEKTETGVKLLAPATCRHLHEQDYPSVEAAEAAAPGMLEVKCWPCALGFTRPTRE